jgi:hypothetical protein
LVETRIQTLREHPGLGWISALRSQAIQALVASGGFTPTILSADERLAEITSPDYPGERLIACFNPALAAERARKREELLAATQEELTRLKAEVDRRTKTPLRVEEIALKLGRIVQRSKVAKHFETSIEEGGFGWRRREETIARQAELDGIYILRTSVTTEAFSGPNVVRTYKSLAQVERVFRTLKSVDLLIRPIRHWTEDHVRAHIFLCLLSYFVQWEMQRRLAPLLYADETLSQARAERDPVAPARASDSARRKKSQHVRDEGLELHSFATLMMELGTRCRTTYQVTSADATQSFQQLTQMTPLQTEAFRLLGLLPKR